jgi:hypothetical protein
MGTLFPMIMLQTLLGALDNLWHHKITERLPVSRSASGELSLHAVRELLYACIFLGLAWFQWRGAWALLAAGVLTLEVVVTLADFVVEDRTRRLPASERVLHTVLAVNFGAVLALLAPILGAWWAMPSRVASVSHGAFSWILTVFAVGVSSWCVRNTLAVLKLRRPPEWVREPLLAGKSASSRAVLVTGATGFIGGHLVRRLIRRGDQVIVLTRNPDRALDRFGPHVRIVADLNLLEAHARIDAIVNLAGEPIMGAPWTQARRRVILQSRLDTTRAVIALMARLDRTPRVLVSASAVGYYGVRGDEFVDEDGGPLPMFQSTLCREWEAAADAAKTLEARVVKLRIGLVLARDGGAFPRLVRPIRAGLGAILGGGGQWVSWIHIRDLIRLIEFVLETPAARGPVNAVSPTPLTHSSMQHALAKALRRPLWVRLPTALLRSAVGEMAQMLVDGQRVVPNRLVSLGFHFHYAHFQEALPNLLRRSDAQPQVRGAAAGG